MPQEDWSADNVHAKEVSVDLNVNVTWPNSELAQLKNSKTNVVDLLMNLFVQEKEPVNVELANAKLIS